MRHMARTLRIDLDWIFERIMEDPSITIKFIPTKMQLADILTKATFTVQQWNALLMLIQTRPYTTPITTGVKASKSASLCEYHFIGDDPGNPTSGNHPASTGTFHPTTGKIYHNNPTSAILYDR